MTRAVLIFDAAGRCIGSEMRSADQMPATDRIADAFGGVPLEKPAKEMWRFQQRQKWWRDDKGRLRQRQKIDLPRPARQRMHAQPHLRWERDVIAPDGEPPWQPYRIYSPGDRIANAQTVYVCARGGISGASAPGWSSRVVFEAMPAVIWEPVAIDAQASAPDPWQSLTIYDVGEMIASTDGAGWYRATGAGISRVYEPDWAGWSGAVDDRDYIDLPVPLLPDGSAPILNIGGARITSEDDIRLYRRLPARLSVHLDNPGYYSDPYIISVETPNA